MRQLAVFLWVLTLAGCAQQEWKRGGTSPAVAAQDLADCRSLAQAVPNNTGIDTDIMASRGHDWEKGGVLDIERQRFAAEERGQTVDPVSQCMTDKGYRTAP
jgi:hypothetical protein